MGIEKLITCQIEEEQIDLKISSIEKPPFDVTVTVQSVVQKIIKRIQKNMVVERVFVAKCNGKYHPVGNLDTLEAHKQCASRTVRCNVIKADSMHDVLEYHIMYTEQCPINPIRMVEIVSRLKKSKNANLSIISKEYRNFDKLLFTEETRRKFIEFMTELGEKLDVIPTMHHILAPISEIREPSQESALRAIINYAKIGKNIHPPDIVATKQILRQFKPKTSSQQSMATREIQQHVLETEKSDGGADDVEVITRAGKSDMGEHVFPKPDVITHHCKCNRSYIINLKNATMRETKPNDNNVNVLTGDHGEPVYAFTEEIVKYLAFDLHPQLHYTRIGGTDEGHTVIISKRNIPKKKIREMRVILDGKK